MDSSIAAIADILDSNNRVTVYGWKALAGSVIGYAMDGFDLLIVGFMLPVIAADLALTSSQAGSLVTWTLMGAVAGGLIFGSMSDHFGRIRVLTWTILIFAGFTGLCAFARGYWDLVAYRVMAGLGLGGEFGIGMALANDGRRGSVGDCHSCSKMLYVRSRCSPRKNISDVITRAIRFLGRSPVLLSLAGNRPCCRMPQPFEIIA